MKLDRWKGMHMELVSGRGENGDGMMGVPCSRYQLSNGAFQVGEGS